MDETGNSYNGMEIAVTGLAVNVVKAQNIEEFRDNLNNKVESVLPLTDEELIRAGERPETIENPNYIKVCSILDDKEYFDAFFFGYTPREAELLDPQVRLFHECAWQALEDAGIDPDVYPGVIGVYGGAVQNLQWEIRATYSGKSQKFGAFAASKLTGIRYLCTRLSYNLDLKGPAVNIQTACSTSLVAIHLGCQALLSGECDAVVAGGVTAAAKKKTGYLYESGLIYSDDGHTRSFDARGTGMLFGEGCGAVILKTLEDALTGGDQIYAVIKSTAVNNDGNLKTGFTAPSVEGQVRLMRTAYHLAEVDPATITYVETHGTATEIGDPIEFEALSRAFGTTKKNFCRLGAVKTNLGHLDAASGIAGFIKTVLAIKYREIPPTLFFQVPNPELNIIDSPFVVNTELCKWERGDAPLRAAVNSLGMGGTNAHVVLEEAPDRGESSPGRDYRLLLLSAKSKNSLDMMAKNLSGYLERHKEIKLDDVAYTLQTRRKAFKFRQYLICRDADDAVAALTSGESGKTGEYDPGDDDKKILFLFPDSGTPYVNMGLELYRGEPVFREEMDRCFDILKSLTGHDLKEILYPAIGRVPGHGLEVPSNGGVPEGRGGLESQPRINQTAIARPLIFAVEYAMAKLLMAWGIEPGAMIGEGSGEYTAACLSGVFSLENALDLILYRNELKGESPPPSAELEMKIKAMGPGSPAIPFISNITGTWISGGDAVSPGYWVHHLTAAAGFAGGLDELYQDEDSIFLEFGPSQAPAGKEEETNVLPLVAGPGEDVSAVSFLLDKIGRLWHHGKTVDWRAFYARETRHCVTLPSYPFDKQRYWLEELTAQDLDLEKKDKKKEDIRDWFHVASWAAEPGFKLDKETGAAAAKQTRLIFLDEAGVGERLCEEIARPGDKTVTVTRGPAFAETGENRYTLNPGSGEDYRRLWTRLGETGSIPGKIVHMWGITGGLENNMDDLSIEEGQERGFYSLLFLAQAMEAAGAGEGFEIIVITDHMQKVTETDMIFPVKSTVLGLVFVIPQEYPNIDCRSIDISLSNLRDGEKERLIEMLAVDLQDNAPVKFGAYRNGRRWRPTYEKIDLKHYPESWTLKEKGVYLITGGLGGVGFALAREFAKACNARLVLTGRTGLPPKEEWDSWVSSHDEQDPISGKIKKIRTLEIMGGQVLYSGSDVADSRAMLELKQQVQERFGTLNGIIHAAGGTKGESIEAIHGLNREKCSHQFRPKIDGLMVLDRLFKDEGLDFFILTSSMTSFLGGWEYAAYTAANFFMDRFVAAADRWISLNLDPLNLYGDKDAEKCINVPELCQTFKTIIASVEKGQVLVCVWGMKERIEKAAQSLVSGAVEGSKSENAGADGKSAAFFPRPDLSVEYVPPGNEIEAGLVDIFRDLFGYDKIGIMDDFFELGGTSLSLIRFITEIRGRFHVNVRVQDVFEKGQIRELARLIKEAEKEEYSSIQIVEKKDYYPLSSAQKRLYVIQQIEKDPTAYNIPWPFELRGILDKEKFEEIFLKLVARHESLRTSFHQVEGDPVQRVRDHVEYRITHEEAREDRGVNEIIKGFIRPFDLSKAPLMRTALIKLADDHHVLMIDIHHITCDFHAMNMFMQDFLLFYLGEELPFLRIQYKDYTRWDNGETQQEAIRKQGEYWLKRFEGRPPMLDLPCDYPKSENHDFSGHRVGFVIEGDLAAGIMEILHQMGTTLFMFILSVYSILLFIYTGREDIIVGVPAAGRNHRDLREVFGMFVNMLPIRSNPRTGVTFRRYLEEVKVISIQGFENQDYPFDDLVSKLNLPRHGNRTPLVETMLTMLGTGRPAGAETGTENEKPEKEKPELDVRPWLYEAYPAKFDLSLDVLDSGGAINMWLTYPVRLFKKATIEKTKTHYIEIIEQVVDNLDIELGDIVISYDLAEASADSLLEDGGDFDF